MKVIYMISDTGCVRGTYPTRQAIRAFEMVGYRVCTREEWRKKRRWQERQDTKEAVKAVVGTT